MRITCIQYFLAFLFHKCIDNVCVSKPYSTSLLKGRLMVIPVTMLTVRVTIVYDVAVLKKIKSGLSIASWPSWCNSDFTDKITKCDLHAICCQWMKQRKLFTSLSHTLIGAIYIQHYIDVLNDWELNLDTATHLSAFDHISVGFLHNVTRVYIAGQCCEVLNIYVYQCI